MTDDLYWSTVLSLNFEGANASTTFTDTSPKAKSSPTVNGNAQISTAQFKSGGSAGLFDGTGDYLEYTANDTDFDFGTGDFTVECWWRPAVSTGTNMQIVALGKPTVGSGADISFGLRHTTGGKVFAYIYNGTTLISSTGVTTLAANTWVHIAYVRISGVQYVYVNGVLDKTDASASAPNTAAGRTLKIGYHDSTSAIPANGYIDRLQILKGYARYTAPFTPAFDLFVAEAPLTSTANLTAPMATVQALGGGVASLSAPMATFQASTGMRLDVSMPMPTLDATGHNTAGENALDLTMPMPTLDARMGARLNAAVPMPTIEASGTTTVLMRLDLTMPMPTLEASGTTTGLISLRAQAPMATFEGRGGARMDAQAPMATIAATVTTGSTMTMRAVVPMAQIEFSMSSGGTMSLDVLAPMPVAGPWGHMVAVAPMATIEFVMRSVVVITYEAYAVNLKPGPKMPNQVTRYTNYPFNQIVRFKNRYIGVADDGLYELGGDTDYDADTPTGPPWAWHTGETDFNSPQKKNVRESMFAGRLGPSATASVSVREAANRTYAAEIVRGTDAQNHRIKYGRGLSARYWSFGWADPDGGTCEPDAIEFEAAELGRKL